MKKFLFLLLLLPGHVLGAETPVPVNVFGEFERPDFINHQHCRFSQNGRYRIELEFSNWAPDFFTVSRYCLYDENVRQSAVDHPGGQGFYVSNIGLVAAVSATEAPDGRTDIIFYNHKGTQIFHFETAFAYGFTFSQNGRIFALNGENSVLVVEPLNSKISKYPKGNIFALSQDGPRIAVLDQDLKIWENGELYAEIPLNIQWPRKMVFSPNNIKLAVIGKERFVVVDIESKKAVFSRKGYSYRDVRWDSSCIEVGAQQRRRDFSVGIYLKYSADGRLLYQRKTSPRSWPGKNGPEIQLKKTVDDSIFWPFAPYNQTLPLGNSYEEYQNYGSLAPYPHPGVDMMAPDRTPVYAVGDGIVKAVLTTSGAYHWRVAVAVQDDTQETQGWLYAHLEQNSIPVAVGDLVNPYDFLGELVPWPVADFTHLHFVKISDRGKIWSMPWDAVFNPLDVLRPRDDPSPPVFSTARGQDTLAFCLNETDFYLDADSLYGEIDIVAHVGDYIGHPDWACSVYRMDFDIKSLPSGEIVYGPFTSMTLSHVIPNYTANEKFTHVLYKNDDTCNSEGNYNTREFFMILTNSDGDLLLELEDADLALDTKNFSDGPYRIDVRAYDAGGNVAGAGMNVEIKNRQRFSQYDSLLHDGVYRSFKVHLPENYSDSSGPCPLVIGLHGGGPGNAENFEKGCRFSAKADSAGFIAVYPQGTVQKVLGFPMRTWNAGLCCGNAGNQNIDDVGFLSVLIDTLVNRYNINPARVYATGISNGGMMCYRLACEVPEKIAAIAPVAATMVMEKVCVPRLPVPVIHFHSTLDQNVPFEGGYGTKGISNHYNPPVDSVLAVWGYLNGCSADWDTLHRDETYSHYVKSGCYAQGDVELYLDYESGHSWPGGDARYLPDNPSETLQATDLIWDFFQRFHRVLRQDITYEFKSAGMYCISVPGSAQDMRVSSLFPAAKNGLAYSYKNGDYVPVDFLVAGKGYFIELERPCATQVEISPVYHTGWQFETTGWHLVGSTMKNKNFHNPLTVTAGSLYLPLYYYENDYRKTAKLWAKQGHWLGVTEPCQVYTIGDSLYKDPEPAAIDRFIANFGRTPPAPPSPTQVVKNKSVGTFYVSPSFPNPFNGSTSISFELPAEQTVSLKIYDLVGREVAHILHKKMAKGPHNVFYSPSALSSGVYFFRLQTPVNSHVGKLVYLK